MRGNKRRWNAEESVLVALVRGESLRDLLPACRPETLRELAFRHKLTALLASEIVGQESRTGNSLHWAAAALVTADRDAALYDLSLRRIRDLFSGRGISTIVLKGRSLSLGKPRDIGDIDLFVPEATLLEAIELVETAGYTYVGHLRNMRIKPFEFRNWRELKKWSNQFEFQDLETGALIELHTAFFERGRVYSEDFSALNGAIGSITTTCRLDPGTGCLFLSMEDRVLLLALHAGIKRAPYRRDFILRHINDFDRLIDSGIDWGALIDRAKICRVLHHLFFLLSIYQLFVDGKIPTTVYEGIEAALRPRERWLVQLHLKCFKDLNRESYVLAFLYRFFIPFIFPSNRIERLKSLLIFPILFPESWRLAEIYNISPTAKGRFLLYLLEPLRWVILIVRTIEAEFDRRSN